jgi:hypothetical protein
VMHGLILLATQDAHEVVRQPVAGEADCSPHPSQPQKQLDTSRCPVLPCQVPVRSARGSLD